MHIFYSTVLKVVSRDGGSIFQLVRLISFNSTETLLHMKSGLVSISGIWHVILINVYTLHNLYLFDQMPWLLFYFIARACAVFIREWCLLIPIAAREAILR